MDAGPVEGPWQLPEGWEWQPLGALCEYVSRGRGPKYVAEDGVVVLNQKCIRWHGIDVRYAKMTDRLVAARLDEAQFVREGDILWNSTGTGTIGRSALVTRPVADQHLLVDSHVTIVRPSAEKLLSDWANYWIRTQHVQAQVAGVGSTNQVELNRSAVLEMPIPMPPLDIQRRIVARIDELFAELDDGESALVRARDDLETYRKSLLKAAVTGELTADWREANPTKETGEHLLRQVLQDCERPWDAEPKKRGKRQLPAREAAAEPLDLPASWAIADLEDLSSEPSRNGLSVKEAAAPTEVTALRLDALTDNGVKWENHRFLPKKAAEVSQYRLQDGDLLVSRANGSPKFVGRCSLVMDPPPGMIFPDTVIRYRLAGDAVLWRWVEMAWSSPPIRHRILQLAKSTAGILKISQGDIRQVRIPIPPRAEMATALDRLQSHIEHGRTAIGVTTQQARTSAELRQAILNSAFRGELAQ